MFETRLFLCRVFSVDVKRKKKKKVKFRHSRLIARLKKKKNQMPSAPEIITDASAMRAWSRKQRLAGKRIGFVPTMVREGNNKKQQRKKNINWTNYIIRLELFSLSLFRPPPH